MPTQAGVCKVCFLLNSFTIHEKKKHIKPADNLVASSIFDAKAQKQANLCLKLKYDKIKTMAIWKNQQVESNVK